MAPKGSDIDGRCSDAGVGMVWLEEGRHSGGRL